MKSFIYPEITITKTRKERRKERDGNMAIERRKNRSKRANEHRKEGEEEKEDVRGVEGERGLTGGPREKRLRLVVAAGVEMY